MTDTEPNALHKAEGEIAAILARLEVETDCTVQSVDIRDIDMTTYQDERQQLKRRVVIELFRAPGSNW